MEGVTLFIASCSGWLHHLRETWDIVHYLNLQEYLSSLDIVHHDLACRNILVGEWKKLKISDFGMSQMVAAEDPLKTSTGQEAALEMVGHWIHSQQRVYQCLWCVGLWSGAVGDRDSRWV